MLPYRTGDQSLIRDINLSSVLRYIHDSESISRAQIANVTGLNKSTVSSLVEELIARGLVHETGLTSAGAGRPSTLLQLDPQAGGIVGVELGVDFIAVALTDFVGNTVWRRLQEADPDAQEEVTLSQMLQVIDEAMAVAKATDLRLLGIGISTPGIVNVDVGMLVFAPNLQWRNVSLFNMVSEHTGLPVLVDNDANAAALGEHLFGIARQVKDFVFVFVGIGLGGGLFLNGELYRGLSGFAGEIGHIGITVDPFHTICHCGNRGCWETYANQFSILERVRSRLKVRRNGPIMDIMARSNASLNINTIIQAAEAGDQDAIAAIGEAGVALGLGIGNMINIFNPEMIVIGGPLSTGRRFLLPSVLERAKEQALSDLYEQVKIVFSASGPDASLMGAVALVVEHILDKPMRVERISEKIGKQS